MSGASNTSGTNITYEASFVHSFHRPPQPALSSPASLYLDCNIAQHAPTQSPHTRTSNEDLNAHRCVHIPSNIVTMAYHVQHSVWHADRIPHLHDSYFNSTPPLAFNIAAWRMETFFSFCLLGDCRSGPRTTHQNSKALL
eukprot:1740125-Amphidinium_carterae.2